MRNQLKESQPIYEASLTRSLSRQCLDPQSRYYGAIPDYTKGYTEPAGGVGLACGLIVGFYNPGTKWYRNPLLLERAALAIDFTQSRTYEDGSIDLMETNFHDSTSNGFTIQGVGPACQVLQKYTEHTALEDVIEQKLLKYIRCSGDAMVNLGFHTPNHRWVVSAALSYCYNITGDKRYYDHIQKFLAEGIDCDENGEYTERSAGTYNMICNRSMMILAEELQMPELLDNVTRNLYMVMKYFEPDETMNTLNSTRQDMGKDPDIGCYYDNYTRAALMTGNPEFAWLSDYMFGKMMCRFGLNPDNGGAADLTWLLLHPELEQKMIAQPTQKPCLEYEKLFVESGIMRQRIGDATLTLIKDRPLFCKLQYKDRRLLVRFAGSFFGPLAQFVPQTLEKTADGYRLTCHQRWGYKRPLPESQGTSDWRKMDHTKRENVGMRDYDVAFDIRLTDGELTLTVDAGGCDNIPVKLELMFDPQGIYDTGVTELITRPGDYVFQKEGPATYTFTDCTRFTIDGGFNGHHFAKTMRGSIPGDEKAFTVTMTGYTPEKQTVRIRYQ